MTVKTLAEAIQRNHAALNAMVKGDCSGYVSLLSSKDDVSWGNPFGPFARGRQQVEATLVNAAARMAGGRALPADHVATYEGDELAVVVEVEHVESSASGADTPTRRALRVTSVYRKELDGWYLVHRHADPIGSPT